MALYESDLIKVVEALHHQGYVDNFIIKDNLIFSSGMNQGFEEQEVIIDGAYSFEITEESFETQVVYALRIPKHQIRGLLIDLLGMYLYMENQSISSMLKNAPLKTFVFEESLYRKPEGPLNAHKGF